MRSPGLLLSAVLLAGCSMLPPPAGIQLTIPATSEVRALPVTVVDIVGIIREATPTTLGIPADLSTGTTVLAVAGRDDAVVVAWLGGACDDRAIVTVGEVGDRYQATVESRSSAMGCSAAGIFRAVLMSLTRPLGPYAFGP